MTAQIAPLTERQAWKALEAHHKNVRELHLRKIEESHHQRNPQASLATGGGIRPAARIDR